MLNNPSRFAPMALSSLGKAEAHYIIFLGKLELSRGPASLLMGKYKLEVYGYQRDDTLRRSQAATQKKPGSNTEVTTSRARSRETSGKQAKTIRASFIRRHESARACHTQRKVSKV